MRCRQCAPHLLRHRRCAARDRLRGRLHQHSPSPTSSRRRPRHGTAHRIRCSTYPQQHPKCHSKSGPTWVPMPQPTPRNTSRPPSAGRQRQPTASPTHRHRLAHPAGRPSFPSSSTIRLPASSRCLVPHRPRPTMGPQVGRHSRRRSPSSPPPTPTGCDHRPDPNTRPCGAWHRQAMPGSTRCQAPHTRPRSTTQARRRRRPRRRPRHHRPAPAPSPSIPSPRRGRHHRLLSVGSVGR